MCSHFENSAQEKKKYFSENKYSTIVSSFMYFLENPENTRQQYLE